MDVILKRPVSDIEIRLKRTLPDGLIINSAEIVPLKVKSLSSSFLHQRLFVKYDSSKVNEFMKKEIVEIDGINVCPAVLEIKKRTDGVEIFMQLGKIKPFQLFQVLFSVTEGEAKLLKVERIGWK